MDLFGFKVFFNGYGEKILPARILFFLFFYLVYCAYLQKNTLNFERATCERNPNGVLSYLKCDVKHVSRRHLRFDVAANLTKSLSQAYMHFIVYYKYNTYKKYAIDLWEDPCAWMAGTGKSYFMDWTYKRIQNYSGTETNINHKCPYSGYNYFKINNVSVDRFPLEQLMPSGRYRIDGVLTEADKKTVIASGKVYASVSDHRIEQY